MELTKISSCGFNKNGVKLLNAAAEGRAEDAVELFLAQDPAVSRSFDRQSPPRYGDSPSSLIRSDSGSDLNDRCVDGGKDFIEIGPKEYKLLVEGKMDGLQALNVNLEELRCKREKNSVLHIAASAGQAQLISALFPITKGIIKSRNKKGDLAFHSAAKASQLNSLKELINWLKYNPVENFGQNLLGLENDDGDTPLHIAVENNQEEMARILVEEYSQACFHLNDKKVSPLYLAIKSKDWELVKLMISYATKQNTYSEPQLLQGKSVVHAAIDAENIEILKEILNNHKDLIESVDGDKSESPLSYAAFKGYSKGVKYLLKEFPDYAYKCDKEGSFPIHKAASGGNVVVVKELHTTWNLLNRKGQSILHVAAASGNSGVVSFLLKLPELDRLINLKDEDGNTPLHLASRGHRPRVVYILTRHKRCKLELLNKEGLTPLDHVEIHAGSFPTFEARLTWMALRYVDAPRSSMSTRKNNVRRDRVNDAKELDGFKERIGTHMLVATLVATVTFAAGFTLPGGYNQSDKDPNIGMAILSKKWAFKVFIVCNTAALYSAILCVVTLIWAHMGDLKLILVSLKFALPLLGFALVMMSVAFMMGVFVVLRIVSWLSYVVLVMGCVFLFGVLLFFIPLYNPSYIKNSVLRFFYSGTFLLLLLVCEKSSYSIA